MSRIESPDNRVLQEDLERAAALDLPIEALDGSRIFVTGATGLIGSQLVKFLLCRNRICHCNTTVIIFARSKEKALKRKRSIWRLCLEIFQSRSAMMET